MSHRCADLASRRSRTRARITLCALAALALDDRAGSAMGQVRTTWQAGANDSWSIASRWSGGVVPNNGPDLDPPRYVAVIDGDPSQASDCVIPEGESFAVTDFVVGPGDRLSLRSGASLRIAGNPVTANLVNAGTVTIDGQTSATAMTIYLTTTTLSGGGRITLRGPHARFTGAGGASFTNIDNTIEGAGALGNNLFSIDNRGTIVALGGELVVDPYFNFFTNTGTLMAGASSTLHLTGGQIRGAGVIAARDAGTVRMSGTRVENGKLSTVGSGVIEVSALATLASGATLEGRLSVPRGARLDLTQSLSNRGTITLGASPGTATSRLYCQNAQLTGGGTILLNDTIVDGGGAFVTDSTIRGTGTFGSATSAITVVNRGRIMCDLPGRSLTLMAPIENAGGVIEARDGTVVELRQGGRVAGGEIIASGSGHFEVPEGESAQLSNVKMSGLWACGRNASTFFGDTVYNLGTIQLEAGDGYCNLYPSSGQDQIASLLGGGTVLLMSDRTGVEARVIGFATFTTDNYYRGTGYFGWQTLTIRNLGTVEASPLGNNTTLVVDAGTVGLVNVGTLLASPGATMHITGINNAATLDTRSGALIVRRDAALRTSGKVNAGSIQLDGTWTNSNYAGPVAALEVAGSGTLLNDGGSLMAARLDIKALSVTGGTVTIAANGTESGTSRLSLLKVPTGSGRFDVNDNNLLVLNTRQASIEAMIRRARGTGDWRGGGLTSSAARQHPDQATTLGVLSGERYFEAHGDGSAFDGLPVAETDVLVKYTWYGDTDFTGVVDFDDYARTDAGFNGGIGGWFNGDFDLSGVIDFDDYVLIDLGFNSQNGTLRRAVDFLSGDDRSIGGMELDPALVKVVEHFEEFGIGYALGFLSAVPEPSMMALLGLAGCLGAPRARRHRAASA